MLFEFHLFLLAAFIQLLEIIGVGQFIGVCFSEIGMGFPKTTAVLPQIERGEETTERTHITQEVIHKLHKQPVVVIDKYPLDFLQVMDNQWLHIPWVIE